MRAVTVTDYLCASGESRPAPATFPMVLCAEETPDTVSGAHPRRPDRKAVNVG
jgi:hypothetical protein